MDHQSTPKRDDSGRQLVASGARSLETALTDGWPRWTLAYSPRRS
jgi:hypothetical protein